MLTDARQIRETVNGSEQVTLRHVIVDRKLIKQRALCLLLRSQHRNPTRFKR